ncbi:MAG: type III pantothenate kinase [Pseudomonadota bacterium]
MLAVDIGNTKTALGFFREGVLARKWRVATDARQTTDQLRLFLAELLADLGESFPRLDSVMLSSVVPRLTRTWEELRSHTDLHVVSPKTPISFEIALPDPAALGADRIADAEAAVRLFGAPVIIVDAGTAVTWSVINSQKRFVGGAIAPGIGISIKALFAAAARLSPVEIRPPERAIGNSTEKAIGSGMHYGYAAMVTGLLKRMEDELNEGKPALVATGGSAKHLAPFLPPEVNVEEDLTLKGLAFLNENLGSARRFHA